MGLSGEGESGSKNFSKIVAAFAVFGVLMFGLWKWDVLAPKVAATIFVVVDLAYTLWLGLRLRAKSMRWKGGSLEQKVSAVSWILYVVLALVTVIAAGIVLYIMYGPTGAAPLVL